MNDKVVFVGTPEAIKTKQVAEIAGRRLGRHVTIQEVYESMGNDLMVLDSSQFLAGVFLARQGIFAESPPRTLPHKPKRMRAFASGISHDGQAFAVVVSE